MKPFVERFNRTLQEECLTKHLPKTAPEATACLAPYCDWYNQERPHQGKGHHDMPPQWRFKNHRPLRPLPEMVDPDSWLQHYHQRCYRRHVDSRGAIQLWKHTYYVGQAYSNQTVFVRVDAQ